MFNVCILDRRASAVQPPCTHSSAVRDVVEPNAWGSHQARHQVRKATHE